MPSNFKFVTIIYYKKKNTYYIIWLFLYLKRNLPQLFFKFFSISDPPPITYIIVLFLKKEMFLNFFFFGWPIDEMNPVLIILFLSQEMQNYTGQRVLLIFTYYIYYTIFDFTNFFRDFFSQYYAWIHDDRSIGCMKMNDWNFSEIQNALW